MASRRNLCHNKDPNKDELIGNLMDELEKLKKEVAGLQKKKGLTGLGKKKNAPDSANKDSDNADQPSASDSALHLSSEGTSLVGGTSNGGQQMTDRFPAAPQATPPSDKQPDPTSKLGMPATSYFFTKQLSVCSRRGGLSTSISKGVADISRGLVARHVRCSLSSTTVSRAIFSHHLPSISTWICLLPPTPSSCKGAIYTSTLNRTAGHSASSRAYEYNWGTHGYFTRYVCGIAILEK